MEENEKPRWENFLRTNNEVRLYPAGKWKLRFLPPSTPLTMEKAFPANFSNTVVILDGKHISALDTAGSLILQEELTKNGIGLDALSLENFSPEWASVFSLVRERTSAKPQEESPKKRSLLEQFREKFFLLKDSLLSQVSFFGEILATLPMVLFSKKLRVKEVVVQLERVGVRAIPIICLVTFLIGLVLAYLFASQAQKFGANIFIVDAVGMGMCRELSPIIVAIIVAGRSGSAFTAQLGTMKINEEIDALRTLGLSVMEVLILPRILALLITLPLLVIVGNFLGILGGMVIASTTLDISSTTFFDRLQNVLPLHHVYTGLIKAPVFALFIGLIGCRMGLSVENNAGSLGLHTTSTVVQSIVAVILLNAAFAVFFQEMGW